MELIIGLPIILGYVALTIFGVVKALRWAARHGYRWKGKSSALLGVLLIAYAIPFGDHTVGYLYFRHLCEKEAGVKIYRTVSDVEGFWWWPIQSGEMALKYGYAFVEGGVDPKKVRRYEIHGDKVTEYKATEMRSR